MVEGNVKKTRRNRRDPLLPKLVFGEINLSAARCAMEAAE